jgi:RNA polymerase sigma factor (sigma-70 family)
MEDWGHWRLYQRSREGHRASSRAFERHWSRYIGAFLGARFRPDEVEEITSRYFDRVYRLVGDDFHWDCPFSIYLKKIVLNLSREEAKRLGRKRTREASLDELKRDSGFDAPALEDSPERTLLREEVVAAVREAVEDLSPGDRHIVRVCMLEGGSGQELAAQLGITRDALYQRLHRAKRRLKKVVQKRGIR